MRKLLLATAMCGSLIATAWGQISDTQLMAVLHIAHCDDFLEAAADTIDLMKAEDQSPSTSQKVQGLMHELTMLYHINHKNDTIEGSDFTVYLIKLATKCETSAAGTSIYEVARHVP